MTPGETLVLATYFFVLVILAVYGWHGYYLVYLYMKNKHKMPVPLRMLDVLPTVTIQLPIYNEMYVADRLIDAVCQIDYPRELLEIQVLDDSTDETTSVAERAVRRNAADGIDIVYIHRTDRTGYKAGALEAGLKVAKGEFVAIFDADFMPTADFLMRTVHHFSDPKVALVQARWGHINQDYSLLTKIQSILLDGHFVLEHGGRNRAGLFFNFNGTAGIWRRTTIADAGGWQHDTLTEDLDLSYRAQMLGWKFVFLPDLVAPAEVPVEMNSFKSQQHRWAKGSIQTCRKLLPRILRSNLPLHVKIEAFFHLSANFNYPLMCVLSVLMAPSMVIRYNMGWYEMMLIDVPLFFAATASVANFYMVCQRELHKDWLSRLKYMPFLMSIGIGLAVNNTKAVFEALMNKESEFARTPKYHIENNSDEWVGKKYRQSFVVQPMIELALGLYFTATVFYALANGIYGTLPFLILFQVGFLYTGLLSIIQQFAGETPVLSPATEEEVRPKPVARSRRNIPPMATAEKPKGGLEDVVATSSAICYLDGDRGVLAYCGYDIHDLAKLATFEEVCYLLWHRRLPTRAELGDLQSQFAAARPLPEPILRLMRSLPPVDGMDALRTLTSALGHYDREANDASPAAQYRKAVRLTAQVGTLVATWGRMQASGGMIEPDPVMGQAANFLYMLTGNRPNATAIKAFDVALVLHADHELNASTFAGRVAAATLTDIYSAVVAAIGTLKGPLHGGANAEVMKLLLELGQTATGERIDDVIRGKLARKEKIPGFGHRVYTTEDPRATHLRQMSLDLGKRSGSTAWYDMSQRIEALVKGEKKLNPNVDFYSASTYYTLGIPVELYTPIFAVSRMSGWTAHILEQYANNRLIRPRADYIGPTYPQRFIPLEQR